MKPRMGSLSKTVLLFQGYQLKDGVIGIKGDIYIIHSRFRIIHNMSYESIAHMIRLKWE